MEQTTRPGHWDDGDMIDTTSAERWAAWSARGAAQDRTLQRRAVTVAVVVGGSFALALLFAFARL
jgi:hypothetical protein